MKLFQNRQTALVVAIALLTPTLLWAQTEKETLTVTPITVIDGIEAGNANSLKQVLGTLQRALNISLSKKFIPVSRDLKLLIVDQSISGDVKLMPAKYILNTQVTGFEDNGATNTTTTGDIAITREVVLSGTAEIQELSGKIVDSAPFSVRTNAFKIFVPGVNPSGKVGGDLLVLAANDAANQIANYVMSELKAEPQSSSPVASNMASDSSAPKIVAVTDKELTIDWGKGMTISKSRSDVWEVSGVNGKPAGKIIINFVDTGTTEAANGIASGCVLRKTQ